MSLLRDSIIELPKILDARGNLSFIENRHLGFEIKRVYWIYDVPGGETRGGHAYKELEEVIIALSGSFDVVLNDGEKQKSILLNRSYYGLFIPKMMWRRMENFSTNAVCMILASAKYQESDYIRSFEEFRLFVCDGKK